MKVWSTRLRWTCYVLLLGVLFLSVCALFQSKPNTPDWTQLFAQLIENPIARAAALVLVFIGWSADA